jgi:hypothetical protein
MKKGKQTDPVQDFLAKFGTPLFPPAPDLDSCEILPITNIEELVSESLEMHNCLLEYEEALMNGHCYLYKVVKPERATLEVCSEGKSLLLCQLKTIDNGEPSGKTYQAVERLLRAFSGTEK